VQWIVVDFTVPFTSSAQLGFRVPIPTFPSEDTRIRSVALVENSKESSELTV
jgi:hypothetical protein